MLIHLDTSFLVVALTSDRAAFYRLREMAAENIIRLSAPGFSQL